MIEIDARVYTQGNTVLDPIRILLQSNHVSIRKHCGECHMLDACSVSSQLQEKSDIRNWALTKHLKAVFFP